MKFVIFSDCTTYTRPTIISGTNKNIYIIDYKLAVKVRCTTRDCWLTLVKFFSSDDGLKKGQSGYVGINIKR